MTIEEISKKYNVPCTEGGLALDFRDRKVEIVRGSKGKPGLVCRQLERDNRFILIHPRKLTYLNQKGERIWEPRRKKRK